MLGPLACFSRKRHLSPKPGDLVRFPKAHVNVEEGDRLHKVVFWPLHIPQHLWFPQSVLHTSNTLVSMLQIEQKVLLENYIKPVIGQTFITYFAYAICIFETTCLCVHMSQRTCTNVHMDKENRGELHVSFLRMSSSLLFL